MATQKTTTKTVQPKIEDNTVSQENTELKKQLAKQGEMIAKLQEALSQIVSTNTNVEEDTPTEIEVGYNGFGLCPLAANDVNIVYVFDNKTNSNMIDAEDLKILLKGKYPNRQLFENGVFYFVYKTNEKKFKVKPKKDLSTANITKIIMENKSTAKVLADIKDLTENGKNRVVTYSVVHRIAEEVNKTNSELSKIPTPISKSLEEFFDVKFDEILIQK